MTDLVGITRQPLSAEHIDYFELSALERDLLDAVGGQQLLEEKLRSFFRAAIDEVIDTARSGRFFFSDLEKTEKTYLGTKFEILLRDWLQVPRGIKLDLLIGGREVDVKSTTIGHGWMIPPEAVGQFCLLLRVNEQDAKCAVGLVRARSDYLSAGNNRDAKKTITAANRRHIWWLVSDFAYTRNFWAMVSDDDRQEIMAIRGGSRRLATLFERYQEIAVSRVQIAAVAQQDDYMKRIRSNGGARDLLSPKDIAILYSETDRAVMTALGLSFGYREFISYRARNEDERDTLINAGHLV